MTEIIQLTGNKSEFQNYVSDPIVLKEESKVCLNKASFSVPVMVNRNIFLPEADAAIVHYNGTFFEVTVNGVTRPISFQAFFDAYTALDSLGNPTIATFYSGSFILMVDNLCTFIDDADSEYDIPTFSDVCAKACSTQFQFYNFLTDNKFEVTNLGAYNETVNLTINTKNIVTIQDNRRIKEFGIIAQYEPRKVTEITPNIMTWTAGQLNNFTANADGFVSVDANPAMAVSPNTFDPNGGFIVATPQIGAGKACIGVCLVTKGNDDPLNITGVYQPENIDVGVEFEILGSGERVLQIIDGRQKFVYYDTTTNAEVTTIKPNYVPANQIFTWDHNSDRFWFVVRKGRPMNGTTEFTITIIQGEGATIQDADNKVIHVAKTTLNTSQIEITTLAYSLGAGNGFDGWQYIPVTLDSQVEDNYLGGLGSGSSANMDGIASAQNFYIKPMIEDGDYSDQRTFWDTLGITQSDAFQNVIQETTQGWNNKIAWSIPENIQKSYWIGANQLGQIINTVTDTHIDLNFASSLRVNDIPREIAVSLMDLPINPNVGSFIGATNQYDAGNINKVVNYVQTDKEDLDLTQNTNINYVYEAYNLVYRSLRNQQKMPITQMKVKLSYKDFNTNKEQQIPTMSGIVKLELLFD
tara:strand:+ start:43 stop:1956 length:1914 start_codon:yes stop_codon:yes gene_type:complete